MKIVSFVAVAICIHRMNSSGDRSFGDVSVPEMGSIEVLEDAIGDDRGDRGAAIRCVSRWLMRGRGVESDMPSSRGRQFYPPRFGRRSHRRIWGEDDNALSDVISRHGVGEGIIPIGLNSSPYIYHLFSENMYRLARLSSSSVPRSVRMIMSYVSDLGRVIHLVNDRGEQRTIVYCNYMDDSIVFALPCKFYLF